MSFARVGVKGALSLLGRCNQGLKHWRHVWLCVLV